MKNARHKVFCALRIKRVAILFFIGLALTGCLQTKEHLTINHDCSGIFEKDIRVPEASVHFIDETLGSLVQAFGGKDIKISESIAETIFGSKDDILKKAKSEELKIEFINFKKKMGKDGLFVSYSFKFDDVHKLARSGIVGSKFELTRNPDGDLSLDLKSDTEKGISSENQKKQFRSWLESDDTKGPSSASKNSLMDSIKNLKIEFAVTMPNNIRNVSGLFTIEDPKTAHMVISGNILDDPSLIEKIYSLSGQSSAVVSDGEGVICESSE